MNQNVERNTPSTINSFGIIVPARYASTRFPGKPLANIAGKPMIIHTLESALRCNPTHGVALATDDERISNTVKTWFGDRVDVIITDPNLPSGTDRCAEALEQLKWDCDVIVNLQGDEPFIQEEQVLGLVSAFHEVETDIATLKKAFQKTDNLGDPNKVKVITNLDGIALYFSRSVIPYNRGGQDVMYFRHIGMYAYRANILKTLSYLPSTQLEQTESLEQLRWLDHGLKIRVIDTEFESPAVDTPEDLINAELHLSKNA
jgi:3-deoxy-manno-octulosonate cytidylyltransferase (CMP-KDO synthetase)